MPSRYLLLLANLLTGCASLDPGPPPVDVEELSVVIADLQLGQSLVAEIPIVIRDSMQGLYYDSILAEHDLTRQEFDSMMWLVRAEPQWVDSLYSRAGAVIATRMAADD